jgi:hypothetical protein
MVAPYALVGGLGSLLASKFVNEGLDEGIVKPTVETALGKNKKKKNKHAELAAAVGGGEPDLRPHPLRRPEAATFTSSEAAPPPAVAGGGYQSPGGLQDMGMAAWQSGMSTAPVQGGPLSALARALQAPLGAMMINKGEKRDEANRAGLMSALTAAQGDQAKVMDAVGQWGDPRMASQAALAQAMREPQETFSPYSEGGRTGQKSSLSGKVDWDPAAAQIPDWKDPAFLAYEGSKDAREEAQARAAAELQHGYRMQESAAGREAPVTGGEIVNLPGVGPAQIDSRGIYRPLRQNLPEEPAGAPAPLEGGAPGALYQRDKNGIMQMVEGTGPGEGPDMKQTDAAGFAARMKSAEEKLTKMEGVGYAPGMTRNAAADMLPESARNLALSNDQIEYDATKREWMAANLRKESQGQISKGEFEEWDKVYFPQPGEPPAVTADKRARRQQAQANVAASAGTATVPQAAPPAAAAPAATPRRARNPQTGEVVEERNGQWVPVQ